MAALEASVNAAKAARDANPEKPVSVSDAKAAKAKARGNAGGQGGARRGRGRGRGARQAGPEAQDRLTGGRPAPYLASVDPRRQDPAVDDQVVAGDPAGGR